MHLLLDGFLRSAFFFLIADQKKLLLDEAVCRTNTALDAVEQASFPRRNLVSLGLLCFLETEGDTPEAEEIQDKHVWRVTRTRTCRLYRAATFFHAVGCIASLPRVAADLKLTVAAGWLASWLARCTVFASWVEPTTAWDQDSRP